MSAKSEKVPLDMYAERRTVSSRKHTPLKPQFYIVKLGFTGVHIIFLIGEAVLTSTHNLCFEQKYE